MNTIPLQLGLIGYPLGHSLSPQLHHAAMQALHLPGEYRLYPIPPLPAGLSELTAIITRLRQGELAGLNVTIPHKQNVLPMVDDLSPLARRAGSANTLYCRAGRLIGDTTDVPGFLFDLEGLWPAGRPAVGNVPGNDKVPTKGKALILGAGGSARAVAVALLSDGWQVAVATRNLAQADEMAASLGEALETLPLEKIALARLEGISLVVNSTPLGMYPQVGDCPWPEGLPFPAGAAVYDLIYNPAETLLLQRARAAGLPTRNGLGMLVEQAALSLEIWSGRQVPRAVMWGSVVR